MSAYINGRPQAVSSGESYTSLTGLTAIDYPSTSNIVVDAMAQNEVTMTLSTNLTIGAPTGAIDGRKIQWRITAAGGDQTVTWPGATFVIPSISIMTSTVTVVNGTTSIFVTEYVANTGKWLVESYVWGY